MSDQPRRHRAHGRRRGGTRAGLEMRDALVEGAAVEADAREKQGAWGIRGRLLGRMRHSDPPTRGVASTSRGGARLLVSTPTSWISVDPPTTPRVKRVVRARARWLRTCPRNDRGNVILGDGS